MATDKEAPLGSIENPIKFGGQDFKTLLEECLKSGVLFSDPTFPAEEKSIGVAQPHPDPKKEIKWQRPKEICENAVFVEGTTGTTDICQGQLGNCWLLAALSCLTMHPKLFVKVVPPNQSLSKSYAGIFHFTFWQYGEWVEVVVDDRLPVREGRLLFSYSHTRNEFWSALVEKAYAKLMGSYGSLKGGNISEGMEDFTGGIAYSVQVSSRTPRVLWRSLTAALSRGSLLSCFIQASSYRDIGKVTGEGLIKGHAYAITDTDKVKKASDEILLLRLRNPWGFVEYCGPWSDKGKEWDEVDKAETERIKLKKTEDGEFWGVWRKMHLDPGHYIMVASTYRPNQAGEFFVRIFSKIRNTLGTQDFTCSSGFLPVNSLVMATPEDERRVERTFDEEAGPDDRLNTKEVMMLFNSVLDKDYHLPLETCRQLIFGEDVFFCPRHAL
ncbi:hypothetical protein INR49_022101 [Caranx melampygus]|nr:hypothetical protein INR49_022101 [Caranx melampygus]